MTLFWAGVPVLLAVLLLLSLIPPRYRREKVAAGYNKNQALYVTMKDGTRIAIDLWLPTRLDKDQQIPCAIRATRYVRAYDPGILMKILAHFGVKDNLQIECEPWEEAGYAVVVVDVRGTGASFGSWPVPWSDEEIRDLGEVIDWIVQQPWSNGRVGAYGISYHGNTAELICMNKKEALKIAAPMYSDYDPFQLVFPGGVFNERFIQEWQRANYALDNNEKQGPFLNRLLDRLLSAGTKPVDGDRGKRLLKEALAGHKKNGDIFELTSRIDHRDDELEGSYRFDDFSPCGPRRNLIDQASVPMIVYVGWLDACTANGALSRFMTSNTPQQLVIGPWSHGGKSFADPLTSQKPHHVTLFRPDHVREWPGIFNRFCLDGSEGSLKREITYYTLGKGTWSSTPLWPPSGARLTRLYFAGEQTLSPSPPENPTGFDMYEVDYSASSGDATRWHTQLLGQPVLYPDRREEDGKLLVYTSEPLDRDREITGSAIVHLYLSSSHEDSAFHVYLEAVSPEGRVLYLTEGILRALHRKTAERGKEPYYSFGPPRTFNRGDSSLMMPGKIEHIPVELYATSVFIKKGWRLRVALAGHDASLFKRYPPQGNPVWQVQRNRISPSYVELPFMD